MKNMAAFSFIMIIRQPLLINKHGQKGDRHHNKCRAYPSGPKRRKKQETKRREEQVAAKSRNIQVTILQWQ